MYKDIEKYIGHLPKGQYYRMMKRGVAEWYLVTRLCFLYLEAYRSSSINMHEVFLTTALCDLDTATVGRSCSRQTQSRKLALAYSRINWSRSSRSGAKPVKCSRGICWSYTSAGGLSVGRALLAFIGLQYSLGCAN